jgi:hypothetical protein
MTHRRWSWMPHALWCWSAGAALVAANVCLVRTTPAIEPPGFGHSVRTGPARSSSMALVRTLIDAEHDFTIDGVVSVDVPGKRSRRATFAVEPGLHSFWCTLHPAMTGTLTAR